MSLVLFIWPRGNDFIVKCHPVLEYQLNFLTLRLFAFSNVAASGNYIKVTVGNSSWSSCQDLALSLSGLCSVAG